MKASRRLMIQGIIVLVIGLVGSSSPTTPVNLDRLVAYHAEALRLGGVTFGKSLKFLNALNTHFDKNPQLQVNLLGNKNDAKKFRVEMKKLLNLAEPFGRPMMLYATVTVEEIGYNFQFITNSLAMTEQLAVHCHPIIEGMQKILPVETPTEDPLLKTIRARLKDSEEGWRSVKGRIQVILRTIQPRATEIQTACDARSRLSKPATGDATTTTTTTTAQLPEQEGPTTSTTTQETESTVATTTPSIDEILALFTTAEPTTTVPRSKKARRKPETTTTASPPAISSDTGSITTAALVQEDDDDDSEPWILVDYRNKKREGTSVKTEAPSTTSTTSEAVKTTAEEATTTTTATTSEAVKTTAEEATTTTTEELTSTLTEEFTATTTAEPGTTRATPHEQASRAQRPHDTSAMTSKVGSRVAGKLSVKAAPFISKRYERPPVEAFVTRMLQMSYGATVAIRDMVVLCDGMRFYSPSPEIMEASFSVCHKLFMIQSLVEDVRLTSHQLMDQCNALPPVPLS